MPLGSPGSCQVAAGVGEWADQHGAGLDEMVGGPNEVDDYPAIAVHGALTWLVGQAGRRGTLGRRRRSGPASGTLPDGNSLAATLADLQALSVAAGSRRCATTPSRLGAQAGQSVLLDDAPHRSPLPPARGRGRPADPLPPTLRSPPTRVLCHSFRSSPNGASWHRARRLDEAETFATRPLRSFMTAPRGYWTSAWCTRWRPGGAARGDLPRAREYVALAARLRPLLSYALPVLSVQTLLELAAATLALAIPVALARSFVRRKTSFSSGPASGPPQAGRRTAARVDSDPVAMHGASSSPRPSYDSCHCCRPTSRSARSASVSTSPATP